MSLTNHIIRKLTRELAPDLLEVVDESYLHAGHAGARPEGESHFRIIISAKALEGLSRVQQHQKIYAILAEEMGNPIHALAIEVKKGI